MKVVTQTLLSNWHFMRWLRLGLGLFVGYQTLILRDGFAGMIAALFLFQALTTTACCGADGCAVPTKKEGRTIIDQVTYEVVKSIEGGRQQKSSS